MIVLTWDRDQEATVADAEAMDALLDELAATPEASKLPYMVGIEAGPDGGLMIGVGHPTRSFVTWIDNANPDGSGDQVGYEPGVPPLNTSIAVNFSGESSEYGTPERTRVTDEVARQAARQYVETGRRPTCVNWHE